VELVAPGVNGRLYVYRGDGQDIGDGTPILWTSDLVGPAAEPALADLTGDGLAEIVVTGYHGAFAFRHDGTLLWEEESIKSYHSSSLETFGWGGPTIGNLDDDPHPEIVIAANNDALYVLDHQGNILDSDPVGVWPTVPVLADITGDGTLDIIAAYQHTLNLYAYDPLDGLEIVWTYTLTNTTLRSGTFGAPAVADITGDGQPEIIINWGHRIEALRADGSLLWSYYTGSDDHFRPSPITVADVTGDGEMNLITASAISAGFHIWEHLMMVLTVNGDLVWEQEVGDRTASASGVAAQDLTGDGVWEILWNGSHDGFLILRGSDGKRLFNEPVTGSGTIIEYPTLGDVDGDGVADVVLAGREGIFVISHVGRWANSRPMWNQHNYHVTNINDDWSIPFTQPNSWQLHNTYRTQTPEQNPAPSYRVEITHTVGVSNVVVLTGTFSAPPFGTPPQYGWQYNLEWYAPVNAITFASELADMQPGETRQINQGTEVAYRLPSGWNTLLLPPLYVTAARILEITPETQAVNIGGTVVYTLTLLNPGVSDDTYTLEVIGLPPDWVQVPASINVPAQTSVVVPLEITPAIDTEPAELPFAITATTSGGGQDTGTASFTVFNGLELALEPVAQRAPTGVAVAYTLTLTNQDSLAHTFELASSGLAQVVLPETVQVPAETSLSVVITVTSAAHGPHPFTISATGSGGYDTVDGVLIAEGRAAVTLALDPENQVGGPGAPAPFDLTVTNLGDLADSYDLSVSAPAGWSASLLANGAMVDSLSVPAHAFNSVTLRLLLTPAVATVPGAYEFSVTARSQANPAVEATIIGTLDVTNRGVQVAISPQQATLDPLQGGTWQVTITNVGLVADTYDLLAAGMIAAAATFSSNSVALAPGQSQTVQMTTVPMPFVLPQTYAFSVAAISQNDERIANEARAEVTFTAYESVEVAWKPASQVVSGTLSAGYVLVITNTGNLDTTFHLSLEMPGLTGKFAFHTLPMPARTTYNLPLTLWAAGPGTYTLTVLVEGSGSADSDTASLIIVDVPGVDPDPEPDPDPAGISLAPQSATVAGGDAIVYTVLATDTYGNPLGDVTASAAFTITPGAGGAWDANVYTSEIAGVWTVTATYQTHIATAALTVTAMPVVIDHIALTPEHATIAAGESLIYTVTAFDADGNNLGDVTATATYTITLNAGGFWNDNSYTSEIAGSWTVTATFEGRTAVATLIVREQVFHIFLPLTTRHYTQGANP